MLELANGELFHTHPQILPGGKAMLLQVVGTPPGQDNSTVDIASIADRARKTLARGVGSPRYLPSGHLVYARNATMFGPPGHLYVYRSYGIHWCANIVCDAVGTGAAVLLRALEPTHGIEAMQARRGVDDARLLCAGPGRLTQALGLTAAHNGADLAQPPFELRPPASPVSVEQSPRIGITRAVERPWRYVERGSSWSSRARRAA